MVRLKIQNTYYKIIDGYDINESSREVKFSNLKIDFTGKNITSLPVKYQECQLVELDNQNNIIKIIYTGYINNFVLPNMKNEVEYRELEIDLLSPLAMATVRTVDAVGTYNLQPLVRELIQPLIDDGFILKEFNITNNEITVNYLIETVESALNNLSNKFNFWWYIDENKNIYINSISYLLAKQPKLIYDDNNKLNGLIDIIPSIDATDYCNTINFVNLRMYTYSNFRIRYDISGDEPPIDFYNPMLKTTSIPVGKEIEFDIPFVLKEKVDNEDMVDVFGIWYYISDTFYEKLLLKYDRNGNLIMPSNVIISDNYSDEAEWVLVRDNFFKDLIIGMQYNGTAFNYAGIECETALMWTKLKISDNKEINKNKGIINKTGIVEKQIDMNEQWKTYDELVNIANSYIKINNTKADTVKLNIDEDVNLNIGDTIKINKEAFLINDTYIITDKTLTNSSNYNTWSYTLKNTNILENFVDLFRASEQEEETSKNYNLVTSDYIEEAIKESYEVFVNES